MIKLGTNSTTIRVISSHVTAWLNHQTSPDMSVIAPDSSEFLLQAVLEQKNIGWDQWFRGRISKKWGELYNNDIKTQNILINHPTALK
jgi:hypothetical protein